MRLFNLPSIQRDFDLKLAGRWLFLGSLVGIVSGAGAILFQTLLEIVKQLAMEYGMGLKPISPGGETSPDYFPVGAFSPWLIVAIPMLGGLLAGVIIYKFAPEAEGHGTDEAINAFHRKRGIIRPIVPYC